MWDAFKQTLWGDRSDDPALQARLAQIRERLPVPVFWLLGKAQSGKTSVIRALTGNSRAEIGNGFRPCTRTAELYDFPDSEGPFLRFLDTRGLGEVDYDPAEDLAQFQEQAHLLMVVVKAMDHAQQAVLDTVREIHRQRPDWPLVVVQTTLHEGYPDPTMDHPQPHPFADHPFPENVPRDLARSLEHQRAQFAGLGAHFVAVDFTLPEDGYQPANYGVDALWDTIETVLPLGLAAMVRESGLWESTAGSAGRSAHPHIVGHSLLAAAVAAIPVPFLDIPLVTLVQTRMFHAVARCHGQRFNREYLSELSGVLGISLLARLGRRELTKLIPGYGIAVATVYTGATTYALGQTLSAYMAYRSRGGEPDETVFRELYAQQFEEGKTLIREYLGRAREEPAP